MQRFDQRQGFIVSAVIHLTLLMILVAHPPVPRRIEDVEPQALEKRDRVFLPPGTVLKQLIPLTRRPPSAARPAPAPTPAPTPPASGKDRISVGGPNALQAKGPMVLQRDTDITKTARGRPDAAPAPAPPAAPAPTPVPQPAAAARNAGSAEERAGREGLRLPPGLLGRTGPSGDEGRRERLAGPTPGGTALDRSVEAAVDSVARRLQSDARLGIPTGTGQDLSGLHFDPQGADFTLWIQRFKDEVYRNWIVPQAFLWGAARGHVDFEFTVERNGTLSGLRMLKSSGTPSLDRAAQNALSSSRLLSLPDDYRPPRVTMQVTFVYGEGPQGS
jgi:TonB family protein